MALSNNLKATNRKKYVELEIANSLAGNFIKRLDLATNAVVVWDGTEFKANTNPATINTKLIFDTNIVQDKTYDYIIYNTSNTELETSTVTIPNEISPQGLTGHLFGNYQQPNDQFGEILTSDDIVKHFLWGLPQISSKGDLFYPKQIEQTVIFATNVIESWLHLNIFPKYYTTEQQGYTDSNKNIIYEFDRAYRFRPNQRRLQLAHRPIRKIHKIILLNYLGNQFFDLEKWHLLESPKSGTIIIQPQSQGIIPHDGYGYAPLGFWRGYGALEDYQIRRSYANGYLIRFLAGWKKSIDVPNSLRQAIGLMASIKLLDIQGDGQLAGVSSTNISMDGMSRAFSSTQSPTNAFYGARIGNYIKQLQELMIYLREEFSPIYIGTI